MPGRLCNPSREFVFIRGYSPDAVRESLIMKPGTPFLQKPFGLTVLARKVREVLDTP